MFQKQYHFVNFLSYRQFFFKYDIPCSFDIEGVHFFPEGGQRGKEEKLKVVASEAFNAQNQINHNPNLSSLSAVTSQADILIIKIVVSWLLVIN